MLTKSIYKSILVITASLTLFLLGCGNKQKEEMLQKNEKLNQIVPVQVVTVGKKNISDQKTYSGSIEGIEQANIVSKIAERVISINSKVDQYISKGDTIIELDKTGPSSQYLQAEANYNIAKKNLERMKNLLQAGAISQQQLDQTQTAYDVAKANYEAAKSTVFLTSPINGVLTNVNVNEGDWVNPGMLMATVAKINKMLIKFYVSETEVQDFQLGSPVIIYSEFNPDKKVKGIITEIAKSASSDSRTFQIKAEFTNTKDNFYKPGMFVKVNAVLETLNDVVVVPNESIVHADQEEYVYIIKNNKANKKDIKTGISNGDFTEVKNGINVGDTLVYVGMNNLNNGTEVSIVN